MAFEAGQYRQLRALGRRVSGPARITALGIDVQIHPDADAFAASRGSQLDPSADPAREPPPHYREKAGPGRPGWRPNRSSPTASSPTPPRPGRTAACPAPSCKPGGTSARSPGSPSPSPPSAPPDSRPTCAWPAASTPACQHPATSSAAPSSSPPPSTPPPGRPGVMSGDEPADDEEALGQVRFIRMRAADTFDGQERVMSRPAYDLQVQATAHSATCGHPGFVPDDYLEHLDGLSIETTITAAELCTCGMWERIDGGYRVLDWEAVEVCLDQVRQHQRRGPAGPGLGTRTRSQDPGPDGPADSGHSAMRGLRNPLSPRRARRPRTRARRVGPVARHRAGQHRAATQARTVVPPGQGHRHVQRLWGPIDATRAGQIAWAFRPPPCFAQVHTAGFYDDAGLCPDCDVPYCHQHWHVSESGYGYCPRGHGKSLAPHW